jgi:hypothetical protein
MSARWWIAVLWPGFLAACALEAVVFAVVDPADLPWGSDRLGVSRQAVYSGCFFVFWAVAGMAAALAVQLIASPPPGGPARAPDDPRVGDMDESNRARRPARAARATDVAGVSSGTSRKRPSGR